MCLRPDPSIRRRVRGLIKVDIGELRRTAFSHHPGIYLAPASTNDIGDNIRLLPIVNEQA